MSVYVPDAAAAGFNDSLNPMPPPPPSSSSNEAKHDRPQEEQVIVDLTEDDYVPVTKKRRSEKREREERAFREYLSGLNPGQRQLVRACFSTASQEKENIMRLRQHYMNQPDDERDSLTEQIIEMLNRVFLKLEDFVSRTRRGEVDPQACPELMSKIKRMTMAARGRIEGMRQERAVARLQRQSSLESRRQLLNDPAYIDSRSRSLVTPEATSTRGAYRPEVNPRSANTEVDPRALMSELYPGRPYQDMQRPYAEVANDLGTSSTNGFSGRDTNYEELVDLALNEAEPLDMPPQMDITPLEHQRQGLGWLMRAEKGRNRGSILADDMGLGKTVQTIALIYANPPATLSPAPGSDMTRNPRLTLVVCPVALIATWADELKNRVHPEHRLRVYAHHKVLNGSEYTTDAKSIAESADIVICTYQGLVNDYKQFSKKQEALVRAHREHLDYESLIAGIGPCPMYEINWHRIVLDEAHIIKNRRSQMSLATSELTATYRLALTGTPMQNNLDELYPIVRFLNIDPYKDLEHFRKIVPTQKLKSDIRYERPDFESQKAFAAFLSALMLRRKKDTVINGRKIIDNLPPKHLDDSNVSMIDSKEMEEYLSLEKRIRKEVNKFSTSENLTINNMLVMLLRMRQAACHPYLIAITRNTFGETIWGNNKFTKEAIKVALRFHPELRRRALELGDDERICAECDGEASSLPDSYALSGCGHVLCAECSSHRLGKTETEDGGRPTCPLCNVDYVSMANLEILQVIEQTGANTEIGLFRELLSAQKPRVERIRAREEERRRKLAALKNQMSDSAFYMSLKNENLNDDEDYDIFAFSDNNNEFDGGGDDSESDREQQLEQPRITELDENPYIESDKEIGPDDETPPDLKLDPLTASPGQNEVPNSDTTSSAEPEPVKDEIVEIDSSDIDIVEEEKSDVFVKPEASASEVLVMERAETPVTKTEVKDESKDGNMIGISGIEPQSDDDPLKYKVDINELAKLFKIPKIFDDGWRSSTKVEACLDAMRKVWREAPDDKVIIFSSFTSFLDVLAIPLEAADVPHAFYTGKMNISERNAVLDEFRRGRCKVLLTSLKAGNVGLTLTQANRVIIVEPFWNPYVEEQAQDRVYRIGQSREVTVFKIRIKDTVEDRIRTLQDNKRVIIESALDNSMKTRAQGLSRTDLLFALGLRDQPRSTASVLRQAGNA